jgi:hypothetical protein
MSSEIDKPGTDRGRDHKRAADAITALSLIETYKRITTGYGDPASIRAIEIAGLNMPHPVSLPFSLALLACRIIQLGGSNADLRITVQLADRSLEQAIAELERVVQRTDAQGLYS